VKSAAIFRALPPLPAPRWGNLAFYQYGGSCDTSTSMDAYGYVDTVEVDIKSYSWRDSLDDEATYRGYVADLFASAEAIVLELTGVTP
jgi:hypothetical protein